MEDRRPIHYHRNTVNKPRVTKKMREMRREPNPRMDRSSAADLTIPSDRTHKTYAARRCHWCDYAGEDYFVICPRCRHCLFCGLRDGGRDKCRFCNNQLPDGDRPNREKRVIKIR